METTQTPDPLETGAPEWQAKAQAAVHEWSLSAPFVERGVNLVQTMEYVIVDQVNRKYVEAGHEARATNSGTLEP